MSGSHHYGSLCAAIVRDTYGVDAETIVMSLFCRGPRTLRQLCMRTGLPRPKLIKVLKGLFNYSIVEFKQEENSPVLYMLRPNQITFIQRYIRSVPLLTAKFGSEGEMLLDVLQKNGHETASGLVLQAAARLIKTQQATGAEYSIESAVLLMYQKLVALAEQGYLCRACSRARQSSSQKNHLPDLNLPEIRAKLESGDMNTKDLTDHAILWKVSVECITQLLRDEMLAEAFTTRIDKHAGNLVRVLLSLAHDTDPGYVYLSHIQDMMSKQFPNTPYITDYMELLLDDSSGLLSKPETGRRDEYVISVKSALEELVWTTIEKTVQEQFGSSGSHVFRVVRMKRYADQDQIQDAALMTAKETKQITYRLMTHNLLRVREHKLPGTSTEAGTRTGAVTYLFYINLPQVARMFLETCYKAQHAALSRQTEVVTRYQYLFTKQQQMEAYRTVDITQEQAEMLEELLTPIEKEELKKVKVWRDRLGHVCYDVDESAMLIELFLKARSQPE